MTDQKKANQWREILKRAEAFDGSLAAFCEEEGLVLATLRYWKTKLRQQQSVAKVVGQAQFVKVEIEHKPPQLPDPKWVAQVLLQLSRGLT